MPVISVGLTSQTEGSNAADPRELTWTVTLDEASTEEITVEYELLPGTGQIATSGLDDGTTDVFSGALTGVVTFAPGETTATVSFTVDGDSVDEVDEAFQLELTNPVGARLERDAPALRATGWLLDNDGAGNNLALFVSNPVVRESNPFGREALFEISLSRPATEELTFEYETENGSAVFGEDYRGRSNTITFQPGDQTIVIAIPIVGDDLNEGTENFSLVVTPTPALASGSAGTVGVATIINAPRPNAAPEAGNNLYSTDTNLTLSIGGEGVLDNDTDRENDPLTTTVSSGPSNGTLVLNSDGTFDYTPDTDFTGLDEFTYEVSDDEGLTDTATVTIAVADRNNRRQEIEGTNGADILVASRGNDIINGGRGADTIFASRGKDTVDGGLGRDLVALENGSDVYNDVDQNDDFGRDTVFGGNGNDTINGGGGDDEFRGDAGRDSIDGGNGDDLLFGGAQADTINGGNGDDTVEGGAGKDLITLGTGADLFIDDEINTEFGNDTVSGGGGKDTLLGGGGDDMLSGNDGEDSIRGGLGDDMIFGGRLFDTIRGGGGDDTVTGGLGRDNVQLNNGNDVFIDDVQNNQFGADTVFGGNGNDSIFGEGGDDVFFGDAGSDSIEGGDGNDRVIGGGQSDVLRGGNGNDTVEGGFGSDLNFLGNGNDVFNDEDQNDAFGNDTVFGGNGNDTINGLGGEDEYHGQAGEDVLVGGIGNDRLLGGADNDTMTGNDGTDVFVFEGGTGQDVVTDFEVGIDTLSLSADLVDGRDEAQVAALGTVTAQGVLIAFDDGESILLEGLNSTAGLENDIELF